MSFFNRKNKIHNAQRKAENNNPITPITNELKVLHDKGFNLSPEGQKVIMKIRDDHEAEFEAIKEEANVKFRDLNLRSARAELETIKKYKV